MTKVVLLRCDHDKLAVYATKRRFTVVLILYLILPIYSFGKTVRTIDGVKICGTCDYLLLFFARLMVPNQIQERINLFKADLQLLSPIQVIRKHIIYGDCYALSQNQYFDWHGSREAKT